MLQINSLSERLNKYKSEISDAVARVLNSGWLVLGPEVKRFEKEFAEYIGARYCVTLANGTDAIELALRGMGVTKGDTVATVANAGMYTTTAMLAIGATPYFMDVETHTYNVTLQEVEKALASGVKAVVVTHLYGLAVEEIESIAASCKKQGVPLLEDCAQAHGARVNGRGIGSFGTAASFSFYPTKNLGALGDGGAVVTNENEIAHKIVSLRQYGWSSKYRVELENARNSRLDEIQAAILLEFLPSLDDCNNSRRNIACVYGEKIKNDNLIVSRVDNESYVAHLYVVRTMQRESLREHLKCEGVASDVHYPMPDYKQPLFRDKYKSLYLENTEQLSAEVLTLPCYPEMTNQQINQVVSAVNSWKP
ncbi:erythromycin biosynthesis sensory transduction protein eryC1 [Paracidovorax avenae]|uniref:DegT/DnrJ/EryC1/StrS family aminotransferase n=1 Tax=Paracidovorax avenae TaxID=80867 RepID=UPI000D159E21|nr:DegT/DnrJ/EryC1/StrS family aminotransferase [Paracidovorax avenae]AVT15473.1 erythromycin biosynthesis sensory transduction protein eryC1 [Paracidovorax avenae]